MKKRRFIFDGYIQSLVKENLNFFLMISILGLTFSPVFNKFIREGYTQQFFFTIMFLASVMAVRTENNKLLYVALILSVLSWMNILFMPNANFKMSLNHFVLLVYFIYILYRLIIQLVKTDEVDSNVIMEAVNVYLLIGVLGAVVLSVINHFIPGSIAAISPDAKLHEYLYFSFVTLTTLGYGDISPTFPLAKSIAVFLAIFGQFYIAVVMAFLVSKFIANSNKNNEK